MALLVCAGLIVAHRWKETGFEAHLFVETFLRLDWAWLGVAAILALATYYARALRWRVMLEPLKPNPSLLGLWNATAIGFAAVIIAGRAGEWVRPYLIAKKEGVPVSSQLAAWLLERIYDLLTILVVLGFLLMRVRSTGAVLGPTTAKIFEVAGSVVGVGSALCMVILLMLHFSSAAFESRLVSALAFLPPSAYENAKAIVRAFVSGVASMESRRSVARLVAYTALEWAAIVAVYLALLRSYPGTAHLQIDDAMLLVGFVSLGSVIQIPAVGGGTQLVTVVVLTEMFRVPLESAMGLAIVFWITTFVIVLPFGAIALIQEGLSFRSVWNIKEKEQT